MPNVCFASAPYLTSLVSILQLEVAFKILIIIGFNKIFFALLIFNSMNMSKVSHENVESRINKLLLIAHFKKLQGVFSSIPVLVLRLEHGRDILVEPNY